MSKPVSVETSKPRPLPPGWRWVRLGNPEIAYYGAVATKKYIC